MTEKSSRYIGSVNVGAKGQIVIPKEVRDMFDIKPGDTLVLLADSERGIAIQRMDVFDAVADAILAGKAKEIYPEGSEDESLNFAKAVKRLQGEGGRGMIAIQTKNLTKTYKNKTAVNALNLSINQGELFALLGVNGAGKTTTIKMLSCLIKPTSGDAEVLGHNITKEPFAVKQQINVSPQETAVAPNLSVRENLEFIAGIYGNDRKTSIEKANKMIASFGLAGIEKDKAKTLSGGWQRRLSIAMALISEPKMLFLDEPTLGLDVIARRELWQVIEGLKGKITIILTTHYLEEAVALSDRIGIMARGELKAAGTADELMKQAGMDNFEDAFIKIAGEGGSGV